MADAGAGFTKVMPLIQLPVGAQQALSLQGHRVLVCRTESGVFALEDKCPHVGMPLCGGKLDGNVLRCPSHNATFDVTTGEPTKARNLGNVRTYEARIDDGWVWVSLP